MSDDPARRLAAMLQSTADYERLAREDPTGFAEYLEEGRLWDRLAGDGLPNAAEEFPEYNP